MIIVRPLINVLGKIIKLPKDSYLDPTTLGSGTPTSSTVLIGDSTWGTVGSLGYVPYIGATQSVDLGNYGLYTDFVNFNLNPVASPGAGQIAYDGASGALSYLLNNSNVPSMIGQTMHAYVHNAEGSTITKGQAVYLYQASGNKASVKLAYNTTDSTSAKTFGLAAENIGAGQNGMVICQGVIEGLNTGMYNPGDTLYLGATPGSYTAVKPYAPNHLVYVGIVERANAGNGQIYVRVQNGYELDEIHDVDLITTPPVNNNVLTYNGSLWVPRLPTLTVGSSQIVSGTVGRVLFEGAGNVVQQDGSLFWDNTNKRLGIGTASPSTRLSISASGANGVDIVADTSDATQSGRLFFSNGTVGQAITLRNSAGNLFFGGSATAGSSSGSTILWLGSNGNLSVGTTGTPARLHVRGAGATSATTALRVENSASTLSMAITDGGNTGLGVVPTVRLDIQGTTGTDGGQLGAELLTSLGWTSVDWTGDYNVGFTHTTGNTSVLSNTFAATIGLYYQIAYTIIGRTAGSITIAFGGQSLASITATGTFGPQATTTGNLTITPTSDFDGTIVISIRTITAGTALINLRNSAGTVISEVRTSTSNANTFIGVNSGTRITTGLNNVAYGRSALQQNTTGSSNNAFGLNALGLNTIGSANTAIGTSALSQNINGGFNTAVGNSALTANVTGFNNISVGASSMISNVSGSNNVAVGASALRNTTTGSQVAIGSSALQANTTGTNNTAIGNSALTANTTGTSNTGLGINSLTANTTGSQNTALGQATLGANITGTSNTAVGFAALFNLSTGGSNTALGNNAGRYISGGAVNLTNSSNSVFIGNAAYPLADSQTNQIVIGESAVGLGSNTVVLGNTSIVTTQLRGSVISGNQAALATTATDGFLYIPTCAGLPTGVPTAVTGKVPIVADTTNNKLYVYLGGAWTAMN
jgi:hypothetical protein